MNTAHITQLLTIGQHAIELHNTKNAARFAKDTYHEKLRESDMEFKHMDPRDEKFVEVIEFTKDEYKAHLAARRKVYNAQRRLDTACRKVAA